MHRGLGVGATLEDFVAMDAQATCTQWRSSVDTLLAHRFWDKAKGNGFSEFVSSAGQLLFVRDHVVGTDGDPNSDCR
jgi:hypothetical protein